MAEEKTTGRRGAKPAAAKKEYLDTEWHDPNAVEGGVTDSSQWASSTAEYEDARVIKEGDPIEVKTDDNGVAQETVVREQSLMGTDQKTRITVAVKGTKYNA